MIRTVKGIWHHTDMIWWNGIDTILTLYSERELTPYWHDMVKGNWHHTDIRTVKWNWHHSDMIWWKGTDTILTWYVQWKGTDTILTDTFSERQIKGSKTHKQSCRHICVCNVCYFIVVTSIYVILFMNVWRISAAPVSCYEDLRDKHQQDALFFLNLFR